MKPVNLREDRKDRRFRRNQSGKRKFVFVIRERGGETLPGVFKSESHALSWIRSRVARSTVLHADDAPAWNDLHARFDVRRINHDQAYSLDGVHTNNTRRSWPPSITSPAPYLLRFAQEAAWREDNRRVANSDQVRRVAKLALNRKKSVDFSGYWQRHAPKAND